MTERFIDSSVQLKRVVLARIIQAALPFLLQEQTPGNLARMDQELRGSRRIIGSLPHFSKGELPRILAALMLSSNEVRQRRILIPLAIHQQKTPLMSQATAIGQIETPTIVTLDTREKETKYEKEGKTPDWPVLNRMEASQKHQEYLDQAAEVLEEGGWILIAPQGGRREVLKMYRGGPLRQVEDRARERGLDNFAYFVWGIEVPGTKDYGQISGMNLRKKYNLTLGDLTPRSEISGNLEDWNYEQMAQLAPPTLLPARSR